MNESHMYFILVKNISFVDCQCKYVNVYGEGISEINLAYCELI